MKKRQYGQWEEECHNWYPASATPQVESYGQLIGQVLETAWINEKNLCLPFRTFELMQELPC